jgi:HEAT repeat protein
MPLIRKPPDNPAAASTPQTADVLNGLASADAEERWAAARAVIDVPGGLDALVAALGRESDSRVREAMFTSLTRIGSVESIDAMVQFLRSDDARLRTGALDALRTLGPALGSYLPRLLSDADNDVRMLSCEIARALPSEQATQTLCKLLASEAEPNVCAAAIEVLAEVGNSSALPVLAQCAARFHSSAFLVFAIKVATDRILSQSMSRHV